MKTYIFIIILMSSIWGCTRKVYVPVETTTVITETVRDTIVKVKLATYRDTITTPDTLSHLSNPYAESYARVSGGLLHHSLTSNAPEVEVKTVIKYRDREVIKKEPYPVKVEKIVEVEKKLSQWQSIRMRIGEISIGAVGILLPIWLIKRKL